MTLLEINSLRNAEQHYLVEIPEQKLYLSVQVGFTIFKDTLRGVFDRNLVDCLPKRVLPISTSPIVDIHTIYQDEVAAIRQLLAPGKRQRAKAKALLRSLAVMEKSLQSDPQLPTQKEMNALIGNLRKDRSWEETFPNVARIRIEGQSPDLRITKKEGVPVHLVSEGEPHDGIVYRRNDSDYYSMNLSQLCGKLDPKQKITRPKLSAIVWYLDLQTDDECFKEFRYGKSSVHKMYSPKALARIRNALPELDIVKVWNMYKSRNL